MINILIYVLLVLEVLCCFFLLTVILVQRSKSGGAGMAFGAGMGETMFGSQVGNILTRSTVILGIAFLVITTILAWATPRATKHSATDLAPDVNPAQQNRPAPTQPAPLSDGAFPEGDFDATGVTPPADGPGAFPAATPAPSAVNAEIQPIEIPSTVAPTAPAPEAPAPDAVDAPAAE